MLASPMPVEQVYPRLEAAIIEAVDRDQTPTLIEFMVPAYRQFLVDLDVERPDNIYPGLRVEPLFGVPVEIVPGPVKEFRVVCG
jgi:hypothetical protein